MLEYIFLVLLFFGDVQYAVRVLLFLLAKEQIMQFLVKICPSIFEDSIGIVEIYI